MTEASLGRWISQLDRAVEFGVRDGLATVGRGSRKHWQRFSASAFDQGGPAKAYTRNALFYKIKPRGGVNETMTLYLRGAKGIDDQPGKITPAAYLSAQEDGGDRRTKAVEKQIMAMLRTTRQGKTETGLGAALGQRKPGIVRALGLTDELRIVPPRSGGGNHFDANPSFLFQRGNVRRTAAKKLHRELGKRSGRGFKAAAIKSKKGNLLIIRRRKGQKAQLLAVGVDKNRYKKRLNFQPMYMAYAKLNLKKEIDKEIGIKLRKIKF